MNKNEIINKFRINERQHQAIEQYLEKLIDYNSHTNLVGKSTLVDPWKSHILDSLQILPIIKNKNDTILDMGTGAGLPGILLSICGCRNVTLVDSNAKKINFLKHIIHDLEIDVKLTLSRLEALNNVKYDMVTSRALANLDKLFTYSQKFLKKNTVLVFLKGKAVNEELLSARKNWKFQIEKIASISDKRGTVLIIKNLKKND